MDIGSNFHLLRLNIDISDLREEVDFVRVSGGRVCVPGECFLRVVRRKPCQWCPMWWQTICVVVGCIPGGILHVCEISNYHQVFQKIMCLVWRWSLWWMGYGSLIASVVLLRCVILWRERPHPRWVKHQEIIDRMPLWNPGGSLSIVDGATFGDLGTSRNFLVVLLGCDQAWSQGSPFQ